MSQTNRNPKSNYSSFLDDEVEHDADYSRDTFASRESSIGGYSEYSYRSSATTPRSTFVPVPEDARMERSTVLFNPNIDDLEEDQEDVNNDTGIKEKDTFDRRLPSIRLEAQDVKLKGARQRWAQQMKLKELAFSLSSAGKKAAAVAVSASTTISDKAKSKIYTVLQSSKTKGLWSLLQDACDDDGAMEDNNNNNNNIDPLSQIAFEEVITNSKMVCYYAAWLIEKDRKKLYFLCSVFEYKNLVLKLRDMYNENSNQMNDFEREKEEMILSHAEKICINYLKPRGNQYLGKELLEKDELENVLNIVRKGGDEALRAFDLIGNKVQLELICHFNEFRLNELHEQMKKSVEREIINLDEILINRRFANFFWMFLFQHNYHRELALWLEVEYLVKPLYKRFKQSHGKREGGNVHKEMLSKLLKYIGLKYFTGDADFENMDKDIKMTYQKLINEHGQLIEKLSPLHHELYPRFVASKAYAEFATYRVSSSANSFELIADLRSLSMVLKNFGLRLHRWIQVENEEKNTIETLISKNGDKWIHNIITFESIWNLSSTKDIRIQLHQYDDTKDPLPGGIEDFILPWKTENNHVYLISSTCPPPQAFDTHFGDGPSELYIACLVIFQPGPPEDLTNIETEEMKGSIWVPYGICLISKYPLFDTMRKRLAEYYKKNPKTPWKLLQQQQHINDITKPYDNNPMLKNDEILYDQTLELLCDTLDISTLVQVLSAILLECRILFVSSYYSIIARIAESFRRIIYPLKWPHVYIPVLPAKMLQYLQCPTPFIIGVHKSLFTKEVLDDIGEEVIVVDLDKSNIIQGEIPLPLPLNVLENLCNSLNQSLKIPVINSDHIFYDTFHHPQLFPDQMVRNSFYEAMIELFGNFGYYRYIWQDDLYPESTIIFDEAGYLAGSPSTARDFRTAFIATQAFSEFITLNNGFVNNLPLSELNVATTSIQGEVDRPGKSLDRLSTVSRNTAYSTSTRYQSSRYISEDGHRISMMSHNSSPYSFRDSSFSATNSIPNLSDDRDRSSSNSSETSVESKIAVWI